MSVSTLSPSAAATLVDVTRLRRLLTWSGTTVALGGAAWALGTLIAPSTHTVNTTADMLGSLLGEIGLLALLLVYRLTGAMGTGRRGRGAVAVGAVLVALEIAWTIPHVLAPNAQDSGILLALDAACPLSALWLIGLAVAVARAGRWKGMDRWAPLAASLWLVACAVATAFGQETYVVVHTVWLLVTCAWLGRAAARAPLLLDRS